jgi:predicted RNase H-like HicB family nuclease
MAQVVMLVHERNGAFGASFPDFPGCTTVSGNLDELPAKAAEALVFHVEGLREDGDLPEVRTLSEVWADPAFQEDRADAALVTVLEVDLPGRVVRVNITVDEGTLELIDRAARAAAESRSGFLVKAARARVQELLGRGKDPAGRSEDGKHAGPGPSGRLAARAQKRA